MPSRRVAALILRDEFQRRMREMTALEARDFILHNKAGVLSLADDGHAYGVPFYYGYDGQDIYFHTHPGLKQRFIVATQEACFTIVRTQTLDDWSSVQAFGTLERVDEELSALEALMKVPLPPAWGETERGEPMRNAADSVLYRLCVNRMSGRYSKRAVSEHGREMDLGGM